MLASAAIIIAELRLAVLRETGFTCSAGVAHNKMLAKLASGMHKPSQQTLVPSSSVPGLLATLPIKKMKQLGGKLGDALQADLRISFVGDLLQFPESRLQDIYGVNTGTWLWNIARGLSGDEVKARTLPKSHSCGKTFPGPKALKSLEDVKHWITELASELQERLDLDLQQNRRMAHLLILHAGVYHGNKVTQDQKFPSKSCALRYGKEKVAGDAFKLFERALNDYMMHISVSPKKKGINDGWAVTSLFIGASNIWATPAGMNPITRFFPSPPRSSLHEKDDISSPSSPSRVGLDEPSSPSGTLGNELMMQSCNYSKEAGIEMKTLDLSLETLDDKQLEHLLREPPSTGLSQDSSGILQNGLEAEMVKNVREGMEESDVMCTPTFGMFGHVNAKDCLLQLSTGGNDSCGVDPLAANLKPSNCSDAQQLVINCSPVEQVGSQDLPGKAHQGKVSYEKSNSSSLEMNVCKKAKSSSSELNVQTLSAAPEHASNVLDRRSRPCDLMSGFLKLKDVWGRKGSAASQNGQSTSSRDTAMWGYTQGEIDEAVLSELPEDIQEELCRSLGVKRPRVARRSTIGDFFKNS